MHLSSRSADQQLQVQSYQLRPANMRLCQQSATRADVQQRDYFHCVTRRERREVRDRGQLASFGSPSPRPHAIALCAYM